MDDLVSTQWLAERLGEPNLVVVDASAHLPDAGRDARADFAAAHIPGARFLELETLKDPDNPVPAALPTAQQLAARMAAIGVSDSDRVVIYDDSAVKTSARAWFILRLHGLREVAILDGGLGKWRAEGRPLEAQVPPLPLAGGALDDSPLPPAGGAGGGLADNPRTGPPLTPPASRRGTAVRTKADILANIESGEEQLLDARGAGRFTGAEPEIRPGMPSGHIPGSLNLPFGQVLNPDGTFKDAAGLRAAFAEAEIDLDRPVVTTCGSGVTASVLLFAMHLLGKRDVALYDGSWSEWGADPETPKATGPAF
jgi:thiosulfate/3-mercaptopyruvate sulfurtransferase